MLDVDTRTPSLPCVSPSFDKFDTQGCDEEFSTSGVELDGSREKFDKCP